MRYSYFCIFFFATSSVTFIHDNISDTTDVEVLPSILNLVYLVRKFDLTIMHHFSYWLGTRLMVARLDIVETAFL
jgi:hypothetical protein